MGCLNSLGGLNGISNDFNKGSKEGGFLYYWGVVASHPLWI